MTKRPDTARRPHRCKGKHAHDAAAPVLLSEMADQDRAVIRAVRMWAASGGDKITVGLLFGCDLGREATEDVVRPLTAFIDGLDEENGPPIGLREPSCGKTTPAERAIARLVSAMGSGDAATAQACAASLVSAGRTRRVMADAFVLATALAEARTVRTARADQMLPGLMPNTALC